MFEYVEYGLTLGNIISCVPTLTLLKYNKDNIRNKNQRNAISALCECQLSRTLLFCISHCHTED